MYIFLYVKCPLFLSVCNETWIVSTDFQKNTKISNFKKIHPVGGKLFHKNGYRTEGHTNMMKLIVIILWTCLETNTTLTGNQLSSARHGNEWLNHRYIWWNFLYSIHQHYHFHLIMEYGIIFGDDSSYLNAIL